MPRWESFMQFLQEMQQTDDTRIRQEMADALLQERREWPWVEGRRATFIYVGHDVDRVALNLDIIPSDPPLEPLVRLEGTALWYLQRRFENDDLLDYLLAINDPMTPLKDETDIEGRVARHWRVDPRNPQRIETAQMEVSVLRMNGARPFPDWQAMPNVPNGRIYEHYFSSQQMGFSDRRLWVYTPPGYDDHPDADYPMLVLFDGQWMIGPLQVAYIADALIKHGRMQPLIIAMQQSGNQADRLHDYVSNDKHYAAILTELLPFLQAEYRIDGTNLGLGGVDVGAIAAAHASLKNPAVFSHLIMISPPLGKGLAQDQLRQYADRFANSPVLPQRIFQSVGRYEQKKRFYQPGQALAGILQRRQNERGDVAHRFVELGSGHSLASFRSIMPEALAHIFPGSAFGGA